MNKFDIIDLKRLGHRVRFLRQGKGWSLAELAERSGVSKAYISDLENGAAGKPNIQYVFSIGKALDATLDDLLRGTAGVRRSDSGDEAKRQLPPGLSELQQELNLTDEDIEVLATVNFRGQRPKDKEGWRFLLQTIRMLSERSPRR